MSPEPWKVHIYFRNRKWWVMWDRNRDIYPHASKGHEKRGYKTLEGAYAKAKAVDDLLKGD